jgi:hypothetical protein
MDKERVQELVRQGLNHVEAKKKRYFKKAMANLPKDTEETICGTCGDCLVLRVRAIACSKCKAPICDQCFKKAVAMEKSKFQWQHAIDAKGKCLHPRHPKCSSQAVMKKIRADAKRTLECEVCEHRRMKAEETTYDGASQPMTQQQDTEFTPYEDDLIDSDEESGPLEIEDRPLTQPNSPKRACDKCDQSYCGCYPEDPPATPGNQKGLGGVVYEEDEPMSNNEENVGVTALSYNDIVNRIGYF